MVKLVTQSTIPPFNYLFQFAIKMALWWVII